MTMFFFLNLSAVPEKSTPGTFAYIWHFQRTGINATMFEKRRLRRQCLSSLRVDFHCCVIFRGVRTKLYARKQNTGDVWKVTRKRKSWTSVNFSVYARPFIHHLYYIYARKIYVRSHGKITLQWKSTAKTSIAFVLFSLTRRHAV